MSGKTGKYRKEHWSKWLRRDLVHIGYWPQYTEKQMEWVHFDAKKIVGQLVEGKINVLDFGMPENWYPIEGGCSQRHPALNTLGYDPYQQVVKECHCNGIKVLFHLATNSACGGINAYFNQQREMLTRQGKLLARQGRKLKTGEEIPPSYTLCILNDVFIAAFFDLTRQLIRTYDIDGLVIDGPWWECQIDGKKRLMLCQYCRDDYRRYSGRTTIPREDWNDPQWRDYIRWRFRTFAMFLKHLREVIKKVDGRLLVTANHLVMPENNYMARTDPNLIPGQVDSLFSETNLHGLSMLMPSMTMKFSYAATDGVASGNYCKAAEYNPDGLADAKPSYVDVASLAYTGLINGSWVSFHSTMDQKAEPHPLRTKVYQEFGREVDGKKEWLVNSTPTPHVGIVYSVKTRDNYAGANVPAFMHSFLGAERMMVESHIPSGYLIDRQIDIEHLSRFGCVILPNVACMSNKEIQAIRKYVKNGGGLIATGETSLYDQNERFRGDFGLADIFGIRFEGVSERARKVHSGQEPKWKKYPFKLHPHEITKNFEEENVDITWLPYFHVEKKNDCDTIATWLTVEEDTIWPVNTGRFITGDSGEPCIVAGRYGKGRIVYASSDITAFYIARSIRPLRDLMAAIVEWVAPVPIRGVCPKSIEMTVMKQDGKKHTVVHLLNYATFNKGNSLMMWYGGSFDSKDVFVPCVPSGTCRRTARSDMDRNMAAIVENWRRREPILEFPICDECVPVYNVKLLVDKRYKSRIKRAYMAPGGKEVKVVDKGTKYELTVSSVDIHAIVIIE